MIYNGYSDDDKKDIFQDCCAAYESGIIDEKIFRDALCSLGYNATDIEEYVRFYRPKPPEDEGED